MADITFTFRVDDDLKSAFGEAAKAQDQAEDQLLRSFMRDYVRRQRGDEPYEAWFSRQVREGLESASAGRLLPSGDVESAFAARRVETRRKLDK